MLCDDLGMLNRFSEKGVCSSHTLLPVVARGFFLPLSGDQDAKPTPAGEVSGIKWGCAAGGAVILRDTLVYDRFWLSFVVFLRRFHLSAAASHCGALRRVCDA